MFCFKKVILCVWVFCLRVHLCTTCMPDVPEGQERALGFLNLDL